MPGHRHLDRVDPRAVLGEGLTNRRIGERLSVSERTVEGHVRSVLAKLGLATRAQVAAWAVERRLRAEGAT